MNHLRSPALEQNQERHQKEHDLIMAILPSVTAALIVIGTILLVAGVATPWYKFSDSSNSSYFGFKKFELNGSLFGVKLTDTYDWVDRCDSSSIKARYCDFKSTSLGAMGAMILAVIVAAVVCLALLASYAMKSRGGLYRLIVVVGSAIVTIFVLGECDRPPYRDRYRLIESCRCDDRICRKLQVSDWIRQLLVAR